jgi:hypothetical protein
MMHKHLLQTFQSVILINSSYRMSFFTQTINDSLKNHMMFAFGKMRFTDAMLLKKGGWK